MVSESGLAHHVKATAANVHDVNVVDDLIYGDEDGIWSDSGYLNVEEHISEENKKEDREYNINRCRGESRARFRSRKKAFPVPTNAVPGFAKTAGQI